MVLSSPLVARLDHGGRGAADLRARADFEMVRGELRRRALGGSTWELRVLSRDPFKPTDISMLDGQRGRMRLGRLELAGPDGVIQLEDVVVVGDAVHPSLLVRRLTVAGVVGEPRLVDTGGAVRLRAEGVAAWLRGARVERQSSRLTIVTWGSRE